MSILYIADLHFGHRNVIRFDHRPYADADEMDRDLIRKWNEKVDPADDVYVVGDFMYRSGYAPKWYLSQLPGHKHLIIGNHDWRMLQDETSMKYWESVDKIATIRDEYKNVVLCHYPILDWEARLHGSILVYGHIHGNKDDTFQIMRDYRPTAYNAAACINGYTPVSMEELIKNNRKFREDAISNTHE